MEGELFDVRLKHALTFFTATKRMAVDVLPRQGLCALLAIVAPEEVDRLGSGLEEVGLTASTESKASWMIRFPQTAWGDSIR
jgi:hypothetical protein